MTRNIRTWMALAILAPLAAVAIADGEPGGGAPANPPVTPPKEVTKDQVAAEYLKTLKATMAKMADADAKAAIVKLGEMWADKELADDTKKPIPGILEQFGGNDKTAIAIDAIDKLGDLGPAAASSSILEILGRSLKSKDSNAHDIYGSCLRSMKKLADPKPAVVKTLVDLLKSGKDDVVQKTADALGGYKDAPGRLRRDLLEEIIKSTEGTSAKSEDAKNSNDVRKWNIIGSDVIRTLNALSGQKFKKVSEARSWFNDHKKDKSWDK